MGLLESLNEFIGKRLHESGASARLHPGQRIALQRQFGGDTRPRDRDTEPDDGGIKDSESRRRMLRDIMSIDMDRKRRLMTYEEMDKSDIAAAAVDMYAEDATPTDPETGKTVWIESESNAIKEAGEQVLENLQIEDEILSLARNIALYGETFERLIYEPDRGVRSYFHVPAGDMKRHDDRYKVLLGFTQQGLKYESNNFHAQKYSEPWDYIHFRLWRQRSDPYGISILSNAIRPWRQTILGEDQALMYRLMRAPDRFAFFVDTGGQGEIDAWKSLQRFRRRHKKLEFVDPVSGRYDHRFNPITPIEDLYLAVSGKDSGTRVEKLFGSNNQNDVTDLIYYIRKFCAAVRIPPEFLGFNYPEVKTATTFESRNSLASQSKRYANAVGKLQRALREGLRHTIEIHLRLMASNPEDTTFDTSLPQNTFRVMMAPVSYLEDQDRLDAEHIRATLASSMLELGVNDPHIDLYNWSMYVLKRVFRLQDDEISKLLTKEPDGQQYLARQGTLRPGQEKVIATVLTHALSLLEQQRARVSKDGRSLANTLPKRIEKTVSLEDVEHDQLLLATNNDD